MGKKFFVCSCTVIILVIVGIQFLFWNKGYAYIDKSGMKQNRIEADLLKEIFLKTDFSETNYQDFVSYYGAMHGYYLMIYDENGVCIAATAEALIGENSRGKEEIRVAMGGQTMTVKRYSDLFASDAYYTAIRIETKEGRRILYLETPSVESGQWRQYFFQMLGASLFLGLLLLFLSGYFCFYVYRSLNQVTDKVNKIMSGSYEVSPVLYQQNQLRRLDTALDGMAQSVKKNLEGLQAQNEELIKLSEIRTDFITNMTHELKTPLTSIRGFVDTLMDGALEDTEQARHFLEIIDLESERLEHLVSDVLSLSKVESKEYIIEVQECDVDRTVRACIESVRPKLNKQVELVYRKLGELRPLLCNPDRLRSLIGNLIENAVKYTKEGKITVSCVNNEKELIISVKDTGVGMEQEQLKRIFERFYRVDKGRSKKQGGTGLGLAIVKHIVEKYNGSIEVWSEVNVGTEFIVSLPYHRIREIAENLEGKV